VIGGARLATSRGATACQIPKAERVFTDQTSEGARSLMLK